MPLPRAIEVSETIAAAEPSDQGGPVPGLEGREPAPHAGRRGTTAGPAEAGPASRAVRGAARCYLIMIAASMSTCAHLVPVVHAFGFSVLCLPSTVTVTVCVPAGRASRAQTTRRGWTVAE